MGSFIFIMHKKMHAVTELILKYLECGWDYQDLTDFVWLLYSSQVIDIDEVTLICNTFDRVFDCNNIKKNNNKAYCVKE